MRGVAIIFFALACEAQSTVGHEFWPETDLYWQFRPDTRLVAEASGTHDRDVPYTNLDVGIYMDFYVPRFRPILFHRQAERDDSRMQRIVLRGGLLEAHSDNLQPSRIEHRAVAQATLRWAFARSLLVSDRDRAEFRFVNGAYSWRYRNELKLERDFKVHVPFTGYMSGELFYDSRTNSVNRWRYTAGCVFPIERWLAIEPYVSRQGTSMQQPRNEAALGLTLQIYLRE